MATVVMNFSNLSVASKIAKVRAIIKKLIGNENFPSPKPSLEILTNLVNELEDINSTADKGTAIDRKLRDQKEKELDKLMSTLAAYIQAESGGDENKIRSAGVDIKASGNKNGVAPTPTDFLAKTNPKDGCVDCKWGSVDGVKSYIIEIAEDLAGQKWNYCDSCTATKITITGLVSGKKYAFRVIALNTAGKSNPSDLAVGMAG